MTRLIRLLLVVIILFSGVLLGWTTVNRSITKLGSVKVEDNKGWRQWDLAAGSSSNPYALAHFLLEGQMPPANGLFHVYTRSTDDQNDPLDSACTYQVSALGFDARWWSLSVDPASVPLNSTAVLSSEDVMRFENGGLIITVARTPASGNWLRASHEGSLSLKLVVSNDNSLEETHHITLPSVIKIGCL